MRSKLRARPTSRKAAAAFDESRKTRKFYATKELLMLYLIVIPLFEGIVLKKRDSKVKTVA